MKTKNLMCLHRGFRCLGRIAAGLALSLLWIEDLPAFTNGQNACRVLGQTNFTSNGAGAGASGMSSPAGMVLDPGTHLLYQADAANNRVLIFDVSGTPTNGMAAAVLTSGGMSSPQAVALKGGPINPMLFVADTGNNRVLGWHLPLIGNPMPIILLGQKHWGETGANAPNPPGASDIGLDAPAGLAWDSVHSRLYVADTGNNRVMVWGGDESFVGAAYVLGQPDFLTNAAGAGTGMWGPTGMTYDADNNRLLVADTNNNRVLDYDNVPLVLPQGLGASRILGQANQNGNLPGTDLQYMNHPAAVAVDSNQQQLFVADFGNNRVTVFDASSLQQFGQRAVSVLGQTDFTSFGYALSQSGMHRPAGVAYDTLHLRLYVADSANNRALEIPQTALCGPNACGGGMKICGAVTAAEPPNAFLPNVTIALRDWRGKLLATHPTDSQGNYSFTHSGDGLALGDTYYVTPIFGRAQSSIPFQSPVADLGPDGATASFQIRGLSGSLKVSGAPGSFVVVSTAGYGGANPPAVNPGSGAGVFQTSVVRTDGTTVVPLPTGTYYVVCWKAQPSGASVIYTRDPASGSINGGSIVPNQVQSVACP